MNTRYSIVGRLTTWFFVSCCLLTVSGTGLLYWSQVQSTRREDLSLLQEKIETLRSILSRRENALDAAKRRIESEWAQISPDRVYVRLRDSSGRLVSISPSTPEQVISDVFNKGYDQAVRTTLESGKSYLATTTRLNLGQSESIQTALIADIAIDLTSEESLFYQFRIKLFLILAIETAVSLIAGIKLAQLSLDPVKQITERASSIGPKNLNERIDSKNLPQELSLLVSTFNEVLVRLEDSFDRLSRFSSDIAHELRTPLNNMRGEIEIALLKERSTAEYQDIFASSLEEIERISQVIDALLFLAKSENPSTQLTLDQIDVQSELLKIAEFYESIASEAGLQLVVDSPAGLVLKLNRTLFSQAIANLILNAIAHCNKGGRISLVARTLSDLGPDRWAEIRVVDTGIGIAPEHLPRVFDRFYRVDPSRSSGGKPGSGLGLAIVQGIVKLHSGRVEIKSSVGQGTEVSLTFRCPA